MKNHHKLFIALVAILFIIYVPPFILVEFFFKDWYCHEAEKRGDITQVLEQNGRFYKIYLTPQCIDYLEK